MHSLSTPGNLKVETGLLRRLLTERALFGGLVIAEAQKNRRAQLHSAFGCLVRPLAEFNLRNQFRSYPVHSAGIDSSMKRAVIGLPFVQFLPRLLQSFLIETGARVANMNEVA